MKKYWSAPVGAMFIPQKTLFLRLLLQIIIISLGISYNANLSLDTDIFADTIKSGLAIRPVFQSLIINEEIYSWPYIFRDYLLNNPYNTNELSIYHSTPIMFVQLIFASLGGLAVGPVWLLILFFLLFFLTSTLIISWTQYNNNSSNIRYREIFLAYLFSFPAIFMVIRANYHSGFANIFAIGYLFLAYNKKNPTARLFLLALAINYRPNIALIGLLEILIQQSSYCLIRNYFILASFCLIIATFAYLVSHSVDSNYTMSSFLHGLDLYRAGYIYGLGGLDWGVSLLNFLRLFSFFYGYVDVDVGSLLKLISFLGVLLIIAAVYLAYIKTISILSMIFILSSYTALLTPVYAEYHLLIFFSSFFLSWKCIFSDGKKKDINWIVFPIILLVAASFSLSFYNYRNIILYSLSCVLITCIIFYILNKIRDINSIDGLIFFASLVALSPIGDKYSNGICVCLVLFTSTAIVLLEALSKPYGKKLCPESLLSSSGSKLII